MDHFTNFFGRFHPLFVHLPIGSIDTGGVALPKIASDTIIYRKKT
jgi:hypothetical protein